jgi:hypothetical protein
MGKMTHGKEMIKAGGPAPYQSLRRVLRNIWKKRRIPEDCRKVLILSISNKGDKKQCKSYREIILLNQYLQIYEKIII